MNNEEKIQDLTQQVFALIEESAEQLKHEKVKSKIGPILDKLESRINEFHTVNTFLKPKYPNMYEVNLEQYHKHHSILENFSELFKSTGSEYFSHQPLKRAIGHLSENHLKFHTIISKKEITDLPHFIETWKNHTPLSEKIQQARSGIASTSTSSLLEHMNINFRAFDLNSLTLPAKEIITNIKKSLATIDAAGLMSTPSSENIEDKFKLKESVNTHLPQILYEYLALSPESKLKLRTTSNQTVDELLIESLSAVESTISSFTSEIEYNQFKKVKITHRYLTASK